SDGGELRLNPPDPNALDERFSLTGAVASGGAKLEPTTARSNTQIDSFLDELGRNRLIDSRVTVLEDDIPSDDAERPEGGGQPVMIPEFDEDS
ncbi:MAG: hypothetical protein KDD44_14710, partial [Bdellovibrionales bacterium]|nr:hypothetical protein [Bdellovibrionales bacterium]